MMQSLVGPLLGAALGSLSTVLLVTFKTQRQHRRQRQPESPSNQTQQDGHVHEPWLHARHVTMPHPDWVPGQLQPPPWGSAATDTYISYDPVQHEKAEVYPMVISSVVPRPIALISSCDSSGTVNLAPYSYFNAMAHNPFTVVVGINRSPGRGGARKDSLANIEATGEFVINIMSEWYVEAANHSCGDFPPGVDELALAGLTPLPASKVKPPRVGEAAVQFECRLRQLVDLKDESGKVTGAVVVAEVVLVHVHPHVAARSPTGKLVVDPIKLQPVCRLGGTMYGRVTEIYDIGRPAQAQQHQGPAEYTASYKAAKQKQQ